MSAKGIFVCLHSVFPMLPKGMNNFPRSMPYEVENIISVQFIALIEIIFSSSRKQLEHSITEHNK